MDTYLAMPLPYFQIYSYRVNPAGPVQNPPVTLYRYSVSKGVVSNFITRPAGDPAGQFWPRGNTI